MLYITQKPSMSPAKHHVLRFCTKIPAILLPHNFNVSLDYDIAKTDFLYIYTYAQHIYNIITYIIIYSRIIYKRTASI